MKINGYDNEFVSKYKMWKRCYEECTYKWSQERKNLSEEERCEVIEGYREGEELVVIVQLIWYSCSIEVCSEVQFLLNIQVRRCKGRAKILLNYCGIWKSSGKCVFAVRFAFWFCISVVPHITFSHLIIKFIMFNI